MPPHLPRTIPNATLKRLRIKKDFRLNQRFLMKILMVQNAPQKSPRITLEKSREHPRETPI
jgi:hypothetical protein